MYFFILILFLSASPIFAGLTLEVYKRMPGGWLCEWGELSRDIHMPCCRCIRERRVWILLTLIYGVVLSAFILILTQALPAGKNGVDCVLLSAELLYFCAALFLLMIASMSDLRYMIIPDQASAAVAGMAALRCVISSVFCMSAGNSMFCNEVLTLGTGGALSGFLSSEKSILLIFEMLAAFKHLIAGALAAGGPAVLAGLISAAIYRREALGFGDIKLMAACGGLAGSFAAFCSLRLSSGEFYYSISPACAGFMVYAGTMILSAIYFSVQILFKKVKIGEEAPLAPWISVSMILTILICGLFL